MKKNLTLTAAAMLAALTTQADAHIKPNDKNEKCYGVAKGGKNDCTWSGGSCMGSAKNDRQPDAWLLLPKGYCERLAGGSLTPPETPAADKKS